MLLEKHKLKQIEIKIHQIMRNYQKYGQGCGETDAFVCLEECRPIHPILENNIVILSEIKHQYIH